MNSELMEWLNLFGRWVHLIAGIMWLGQTWLFQWMERAMDPPREDDPNLMGELWMVHGGGFYFLKKLKWPRRMPNTLHWFKWEAAMTWLSGIFLLAVVYWMGSPLLPYGSEWSRAAGIAVSAASLVLAWVGYAAIFRSPLGRNEAVGAVVGWLATLAAAWALGQVLTTRAVYLHIGAMYGTIMVANVWMVIIPSQKKIMAIMEKGGTPDYALSQKGKNASRQNTFMAIPLLFTMISSHFPAATFGRDHYVLVLGLMILLGFAGAKLLRDL